jgi:ribonuclease P protein component
MRNTIKRQVYNVSLNFEASLVHAAHVVRLRSGFDRKHFVSATSMALKAAVKTELIQLFSKATGVTVETVVVAP